MNLKELRISKKITQLTAAKYLSISLRSYLTYENDSAKYNTNKYKYLYDHLSKYNYIDEEHGTLKIEEIIEICNPVFEKYNIEFCYLFGSYAKHNENEKSDVDLLISTSLTGLRLYEIAEELREVLKKKVDLLNLEQLNNNIELTKEILKNGIKIYGQYKGRLKN